MLRSAVFIVAMSPREPGSWKGVLGLYFNELLVGVRRVELHRRAAIVDQGTRQCAGKVRLAGSWRACKEECWAIGAQDGQCTLQQHRI